jgi:type II secretory pathway component PulC
MANTAVNKGADADGLLSWSRRGVFLALIGLAGWMVVKLVLIVMAPTMVWEPVSVSTSPSVGAVTVKNYDFSTNPFEAGDADISLDPVIQPGTDAPETTLNLTLVGLRSGENGTAFIRTPDGQDKNYYVADEVLTDVKLRAVFPGYVLIDVNGQTQRLTMQDNTLSTAARSDGASSGLQTLRVADARTLLSQARLTLAQDETGRPIGVQIEPRTTALNLRAYGLERGDIITRFGGVNLNQGRPDINALRQLATRGQAINIDLIRDGQPMTITIGLPS